MYCHSKELSMRGYVDGGKAQVAAMSAIVGLSFAALSYADSKRVQQSIHDKYGEI